MNIAWEQLRRLPVVTESGQSLGVVEGVSIQTDSHSILHYHVKISGVLAGLFAKELLISPAQVVGITDKAMTVKDTVTQAVPASGNKKTRLAFSAPKGVEMSETD